MSQSPFLRRAHRLVKHLSTCRSLCWPLQTTFSSGLLPTAPSGLTKLPQSLKASLWQCSELTDSEPCAPYMSKAIDKQGSALQLRPGKEQRSDAAGSWRGTCGLKTGCKGQLLGNGVSPFHSFNRYRPARPSRVPLCRFRGKLCRQSLSEPGQECLWLLV